MGLLDFLKREKKVTVVRHTIKVMPRDYKRVLEERERSARGAAAEIDGVAQAASGG